MVTDIDLNTTKYTYQGMETEKRFARIDPRVRLSLDLDTGPADLTVRLNDHELAALRALFDQIEARVLESLKFAE